MIDILIDDNRDLSLTEDGDIILTQSVPQAVTTRLNWWSKEWRFIPQFGIPYLEKVFVKNPNLNIIRSEFRKAINSVDEVTESEVTVLSFDKKTRKCKFDYKVKSEKEGWLPSKMEYIQVIDQD